MSSKLKDKEPKSLLENKVFQAAVIVSIILLSSVVFVSQTDRIFGKAAAGTPITGMIVLYDKDPTTNSYVQSINFDPVIYLPSEDCVGVVNYCFGNMDISSSVCMNTELTHLSGRKYIALLSEVVINETTLKCSYCGTHCSDSKSESIHIAGTDFVNIVSYTQGSCGGSSGNRAFDAALSIKKGGTEILSLKSSSNGCLYCSDSKEKSLPNIQLPLDVDVSCSASAHCSGGASSISSVKIVKGPTYPVSHVSISYECVL